MNILNRISKGATIKKKTDSHTANILIVAMRLVSRSLTVTDYPIRWHPVSTKTSSQLLTHRFCVVVLPTGVLYKYPQTGKCIRERRRRKRAKRSVTKGSWQLCVCITTHNTTWRIIDMVQELFFTGPYKEAVAGSTRYAWAFWGNPLSFGEAIRDFRQWYLFFLMTWWTFFWSCLFLAGEVETLAAEESNEDRSGSLVIRDWSGEDK